MSRMGRKLSTAWRVFATGFVFVLFGVGALFISLTMFPLLRLSTFDSDVARKRIQRGMQLTFRVYMEVMRVLGILTYRVEGAERLRESGRLIVANHPTLLDVVLLVSQMPEVDCIVKRGLWRNPFLRWLLSFGRRFADDTHYTTVLLGDFTGRDVKRAVRRAVGDALLRREAAEAAEWPRP